MKNYIGSIIGVLIIVIAFAMFWNNGDRGIRQAKLDDYNEVMKIEEEDKYLLTPTSVVSLYCKIEKLLYSTNFEKEKNSAEMLDNLLSLQVSLCSQELIDNNGGRDGMYIRLRDGSTSFLEKGLKIIDTKLQTSSQVKADENGNVLKFVNVIQYVNKGDNSYRTFCVKQDNKGNWKIATFSNVEKFELS